MSELFSLEAQKRDTIGKSAARALRKEGKLPAVIYSKGSESLNITLDSKIITSRYLKGRFKTQLCEIKLGSKNIKALPKDISFHPVTDNIEHVDFYSLEKGQEITLNVPMKFTNSSKSVGVKRGGVVNIGSRTIELVCTLENIPKEIIVDLENLKIGQSIHQSDLILPEGVKALSKNLSLTVVAITGRSSKEDSEETAEAGEEEDKS